MDNNYKIFVQLGEEINYGGYTDCNNVLKIPNTWEVNGLSNK